MKVIDLTAEIENDSWLQINRLKRKAIDGDKDAQKELKKLGIKYK